ncbi:MAG: hypothetical protein ACK4F8_15300 [Aquabacterium sp.]
MKPWIRLVLLPVWLVLGWVLGIMLSDVLPVCALMGWSGFEWGCAYGVVFLASPVLAITLTWGVYRWSAKW